MPGQWTSIETNFPSLTGNEPVADQVRQMYNYLYILTEQLKYNLSNLNAENFNTTALNKLTEDTSSEAAKLIAEDLKKISELYKQLNARVQGLSGNLTALSDRVKETEDLAGIVEVQEDGATLGAGGKALRLVGEIYINGVLFAPQENTEQEGGA